MRSLLLVLLFPFSASFAYGQSKAASTIEGYWQDIAGRTTFQRNVAPTATYGDWHARELDARYPQAKHIRKVKDGYELKDLNYPETDYTISVLSASVNHIDYIRQASWSPCRMHHACRLNGEHMICSLLNVCKESSGDVVDWRGEERYLGRAHCARDGSAQLQGFPIKCR